MRTRAIAAFLVIACCCAGRCLGAGCLLLQELLAGLKRGVSSAAGWLAAAEMLLEKHQQLQQQSPSSPQSAALTSTAQAALDAAKEGLKYVAHRDFLGKEHMEQVSCTPRAWGGMFWRGAGFWLLL